MVYNFVAKQSAGIFMILSFYYHYYRNYIAYYHIFLAAAKKNLGCHRFKDGGDLEQLWQDGS